MQGEITKNTSMRCFFFDLKQVIWAGASPNQTKRMRIPNVEQLSWLDFAHPHLLDISGSNQLKLKTDITFEMVCDA